MNLFPKYPTVSRDIALVVPIEVTNQQIVDCIKKNGGAYLKDIRLFDVYKGENIGKGFRIFSLHASIQQFEANAAR